MRWNCKLSYHLCHISDKNYLHGEFKQQSKKYSVLYTIYEDLYFFPNSQQLI